MIVAHLDTGRSWRGGQGQVLLLMRGLRARGHETVLLAPPGPLAERTTAENLRWVRWISHGEFDLPAVFAATGALRALGPDIAHVHTAHAHALGVPAARMAGVPGVVVSRRVDFAVATRDDKASVAVRLAFDDAESYVKPAAGGVPPADPAGIRQPLQRIAQILSTLIESSSTTPRRNS